ncbi:TIGR04438 family Trp-rich protein [Polaromonas sp. C04]|uniref:TIGR04438 family Trp-rich protein n=1 Tax=Polaromonas sp. C04 TaxID=1945857 RepID=UPI0009861AA5|nr:TIGR04438 family Trp-rich protein [Polaromonas sp. C04]OOG55368.1 hypothetical protein B0E49_07880 [Polaromonas sp. C04]
MYLLGIGIILLLMKYLAIGPVTDWSWWLVLSPFALAVVWWTWADLSGYSKKKAVEKMDQRKADRIEKNRVALGIGTRKGAGKRR